MLRRLIILAAVAADTPLAAQDPSGWNSARALEHVERARQRRALPQADTGLVNYRAKANGYVYFYLDRKDSQERTLVKVDQIALEVYWGTPRFTKQRIVGLRDVSRLPNRINYHLDHLTVVQDEFGDVIRLGDGDEVRDVPHPVAPGAEQIYDYRVADSLTLRLPGAAEPVRVYEVQVRPREPDRPAFVGSIYVDRDKADLVRMTFTFTPSSYVDRRLDYIHVSLDNGLWEGRYWLPHEQRVEIRRQVPELDFPAGGVIRAVLRIADYRFNESLPPNFFRGPAVTALPREMRETHPFDEGIFEGLDVEGLSPNVDLAALKQQAVKLLGQRYLSGLPRLRLHIPNSSSVLRYNRAEGIFLGAGLAYAPAGAVRLETNAGFALEAERLSLGARLRFEPGERTSARLDGYRNALRDMGQRAGAPGVLNTFSAALAGSDYLDPYHATGAGLGLEHRFAGSGLWRLGARVSVERHDSARQVERSALFDDEAAFRAIRAIPGTRLLELRATLGRDEPRGAAAAWSAELALDGGAFDTSSPSGEAAREVEGVLGRAPSHAEGGFARLTGDLSYGFRSGTRNGSVELRGSFGATLGDVPPQRLFILGGRGTLPGYAYRGFAGDAFALAEAELSRDLVAPWLRVRGLAAAGWTRLGDHNAEPIVLWGVRETAGLRVSVGAGFGLVYDILRFDVVRGLNGGHWQGVLSVKPELWDIL